MRNQLKLIAHTVVIALSCSLSGQANAGGGLTGGATEITQILNNTELMAMLGESTQQTAQMVQQSVTQAQLLWHDIENLKKLKDSFSKGQLIAMAKEAAKVLAIQLATEDLHGDLNELMDSIKARQIEAAKQGLTTAQYVTIQKSLIDGNNAAASIRIKREQQIIESIKDDHKQINELAEQIPHNRGMQEQLGLMNTQMNKSLQQLARVSELLAQSNDNVGKANAIADRNSAMIKNREMLLRNQAVADKVAADLEKIINKESTK